MICGKLPFIAKLPAPPLKKPAISLSFKIYLRNYSTNSQGGWKSTSVTTSFLNVNNSTHCTFKVKFGFRVRRIQNVKFSAPLVPRMCLKLKFESNIGFVPLNNHMFHLFYNKTTYTVYLFSPNILVESLKVTALKYFPMHAETALRWTLKPHAQIRTHTHTCSPMRTHFYLHLSD